MIDLVCSKPQYAAHLQPLWDALPQKGAVVTVPRERQNSAVVVASGRDLARAHQMGYRQIALVEHGIGQSYANGSMGYPGGRGRGFVGLFLSPNATAAGKDSAAYPKATVTAIGDPRLDTLPSREPGPPCVAISFHWTAMNQHLSALSHYRGVLKDLAKAFPLIGHAHPMAAQSLIPMYRRLGIEYVADFDDVCRRADLYIADNTSTLYEFASTGRPVVVLNRPEWDRDVELGLRFWEASRVGINVEGPEELVAAVGRALQDPPEARADREHALSVAYTHRSGAAERGAAAITAWLQ